jgi:hypothetical protein
VAAWLRVILALVPLLTSCSSLSLGWQMGRNEGRTISTVTDEGAEYLRLLCKFDGTARDVQAEYGDPAYITVHDTRVHYFYYIDRDTVVVLERGLASQNSAATAHSPIPDEFMSHLGLVSRTKIEANRSSPARSASE